MSEGYVPTVTIELPKLLYGRGDRYSTRLSFNFSLPRGIEHQINHVLVSQCDVAAIVNRVTADGKPQIFITVRDWSMARGMVLETIAQTVRRSFKISEQVVIEQMGRQEYVPPSGAS